MRYINLLLTLTLTFDILTLVELIRESAITMAKTTFFCHDAKNQLSFSPHPQCLVGFISNLLLTTHQTGTYL